MYVCSATGAPPRRRAAAPSTSLLRILKNGYEPAIASSHRSSPTGSRPTGPPASRHRTPRLAQDRYAQSMYSFRRDVFPIDDGLAKVIGQNRKSDRFEIRRKSIVFVHFVNLSDNRMKKCLLAMTVVITITLRDVTIVSIQLTRHTIHM